jgi:hypothetical protein
VFVQVDGGAHLCALKDQRLLLVAKPPAGGNASDGLYAMLWPVTW